MVRTGVLLPSIRPWTHAAHRSTAAPAVPCSTVVEENAAAMCRSEQRVCWSLARDIDVAMEPGAYSVLSAALRLGPCRVTDLAATLGMSMPAVSGQVAALARLGLLERNDAVADERSRPVTLTDEGSRRVDRACDARRAYFRKQLQGWDPADVVELVGLLTRLNEAYLTAELPVPQAPPSTASPLPVGRTLSASTRVSASSARLPPPG